MTENDHTETLRALDMAHSEVDDLDTFIRDLQRQAESAQYAISEAHTQIESLEPTEPPEPVHPRTILVGNPNDGFTAIGPFPTANALNQWAEQSTLPAYIIPMTPPGDSPGN